MLFKCACHRLKFPATEIDNTPAEFSGSRVRQRESLNILSVNPKAPCNASICLQEEWSSQIKLFKITVADEVSSGVMWTSECIKLQKGGRGTQGSGERSFNAGINCHDCFLVLTVFFL